MTGEPIMVSVQAADLLMVLRQVPPGPPQRPRTATSVS